MNLKLKIWRQKDPNTRGKFVNYQLRDISPDSSFLEMLDVLNEELVSRMRNRSYLITTAGKESVEPAECISTGDLMVRIP